MTQRAKDGYIRFFWVLVFILFARHFANATTYMGKDNENTSYYICKNNKEVAELLGYAERDFDLSVYNVEVRKADKTRTEDDSNIYVVLINTDDTFVVCFRGREYDIFFYSFDIN